ncbi:MAG: protein kinase [Deltaproteobacteria bacterium]|nr:protein kinase [Deltaproteobacteria bacterium]
MNILLYDDPGSDAEAIIGDLHAAGYVVHHAASPAAVGAMLRDAGPARTDELGAVILDISGTDPRSSAVVKMVEANPTLRHVPTVYLVRPGQSTPGDDQVMALQHPFTGPALVRALETAASPVPAPQLSSGHGSSLPSGTTVAPIDPPSRVGPEPVMVGDYELIDEIASGGMGKVLLAQRHTEFGFQRLFALKMMHPHMVQDEDLRGMFLDEAALASRIHHPNVAAIVDLGVDDDRPFVVIQYVEGCSFYQLQRGWEGPRPIAMVLPILIDTLAGLQAAHELTDDDGNPLRFIHRDVSPENILVGVDGIARITDFGVAKARGRITCTRKGVRKGKLLYLAPEQLLESPDMDARVDVFAAGVVLWNALTGKRLFSAESPAGIMRNILEADIPPPSSLDSRINGCLDEICLRALARDPQERYPSARAMADDLRAFGTEYGLLAPTYEIGHWVEVAAGEGLRARRRTIQRKRQVSSVSRVMGSLTPADTPAQARPPGEHGGAATLAFSRAHAATDAAAPALTEVVAEPKSRRWGVFVGGTLAGVLATMGVVMTCGEPTPVAASTHQARPAPHAAEASAMPTARAAAPKTGAVMPSAAGVPAPTSTPAPAAVEPPTPAAGDPPSPSAPPQSGTPSTATPAPVEPTPEGAPSGASEPPAAPTPAHKRSTKRRPRRASKSREAEPTAAAQTPAAAPPSPTSPSRSTNPLGDGPESNPYTRGNR